MQIAFNASILRAPRTGIGNYIVELVQALDREKDLGLAFFNGWAWSEKLPQASLPGYSRTSYLLKRWLPRPYELRRYVEQLCFSSVNGEADIYHEPSLWPFEFDGPMVMTLHDLTHVHYRDTQPKDRLLEIDRRVSKGVERASHILVDSDFIANEVHQYYGVSRDRLTVAPLGCSRRFHPRDEGMLKACLSFFKLVPRQYFLCVGTLEPRKNIQIALRAHALLPVELQKRFPLVIVGVAGWNLDQLNLSLQHALSGGTVRIMGYLSDSNVAELVAGAKGLVFPSVYEGFGLPVLESMASGTPVVLTAMASMPEVAGSAGLYFDAYDEVGCMKQMIRLIEDHNYWQQQRIIGLHRSKEFTWQRCAALTASVYRRIVN